MDWLTGDIITHSQDNYNGYGMGPGNVTFTSPHAGFANVSGSVWITRDIGRSVNWALYINNVLITNGNVQSGDPYNRDNPLNLADGLGGATALENISLQTGDVLKLEFTSVSSGGDLVGVNLTVSYNTQQPTAVMFGPSSYLSFADSPFYNNTEFSIFTLRIL